MMNKTVGLVMLLLVGADLPAAAQSRAQGPQECAALRNLQLPGIALSEISADWVPSGPSPNPLFKIELPAYCRLQATLDRRKGVDGQPYGIGFSLTLPGNWSGRFLFQGGGGFNGVLLRDPLGGPFGGSVPALARGFAVVTTDSGHHAPGGNSLDATFLRDQQATLDFAYQAVERVTAVAKAIIDRYYTQPVSRSYYVGCSTGGREAMLAAQRYPMEFDGVIAGAPNMRINYAVLGVDWINVQLDQVAPRGSNGQPVTRDALSSAQKQAVIERIRNRCDANDGVRDGLVFNTSACAFDPKTLVCGKAFQDSSTAGSMGLLPRQRISMRQLAGPTATSRKR